MHVCRSVDQWGNWVSQRLSQSSSCSLLSGWNSHVGINVIREMTDAGVELRKSHKEWRKEVKKLRRKRARQRLAAVRKANERERENSPTYLLELHKKKLFEEFESEKEAEEREKEHLKWLEEEERAQKKWREEKRLKKTALEEKQKELDGLRKKWEVEQKKIKEQKEKLEALQKEEERRRQRTLEKINDFICQGGDLPSELLAVIETHPEKEICSFHQKVGACRFGNLCSRNHQYFKISNVLLFQKFYSHFTLDQSKSSEYDTDIGLEYEDSDMYQHFREFYNDIVPELKRFGEVTMVKVCCNTEVHLRGNVYVEYRTEREALGAYQKFQGRWYGGKQLNIEFVKITDWGSAVCGDFARQRCPKGKSCNFLHVFRNPRNEFSVDWTKKRNFEDEYDKLRNINWRWSETPSPSFKKFKRTGSNKRKVKSCRRKSEISEHKRKSSKSPAHNRSTKSCNSFHGREKLTILNSRKSD